ncbi:MAG: class I SAM-dependent methyltransferase [Salinibacter sp.]
MRAMPNPIGKLRAVKKKVFFRYLEATDQLSPLCHADDIEGIDAELSEAMTSHADRENVSTEIPKHGRGSEYQRTRLTQVAGRSAQLYDGSFLEIGAFLGHTTVWLAEKAREHNRKVIVVDPWQPGTQNCDGDEYQRFLENTYHQRDVIDVHRSSSLAPDIQRVLGDQKFAFAFVDGLHTYRACLSDIFTIAHAPIIAVDDIRWKPELMLAFRQAAKSMKKLAYHHSSCREGYLVDSRLLDKQE